MPEVPLEFPRAWVEFNDPAEEDQIIKADLTWLTSKWMCTFGQGCKGIYETAPKNGCCTLGAHFSAKKDEKRVTKWVEMLDETTWANKPVADKKGWVEKEDGQRKTRVHNGGCIFLNPEGFPAGDGCALHHLAAREGVSFVETKPDVCWQLPIRRDYENRTLEDGTEQLVVIITEYDRRGWGSGGHDLDWYCSGNTEAHVATDAVYVTNEAELTELIGKPAYDELVKICQAREEVLKAMPNNPLLQIHPADPK